MALDRFTLRKNPDITFYKSLGTGEGKTFTPSDADSRTWAIVISTSKAIDNFGAIKPFSTWKRFALSEEFFELETISSHGFWKGAEPFLPTTGRDWKGEVATITRARIAWRENLHFWRAVPPVTQTLLSHEGLISAIGIGEAPVGLQGTFSHWRSQEALRAFAYQSEAHQRAIAQTAERRWYKEELFARFAVKNHIFVTLQR
jgi:hypothetical protein